jgi:hypothetical protein
MPAKKQKPLPKLGSGLNGTSIEDMISIDMSDVLSSTIDMNTITIPSYSGTNISSTAYTTGYNYNYNISDCTITGSNSLTANVEINSKGLDLKNDADIKIGERSLKEFMNGVEEQLAILRPAPELEAKWDQLKELRQQYEALKADILEKQKIMKILKD